MSTLRRTLTVSLALPALVIAACSDPEPPVTIHPRNRTSAALLAYESCEDLERDLRANVLDRVLTDLDMQRTSYLESGYGRGEPDLAVGAPEAAEDAAPADGATGGRQEGVDFSGTNNQESGVDEGDIVKTDGYFIYSLHPDRLEILGVPEFGQLTHVSSVDIDGYPTQMLLHGDRAVVFSSIYPYEAIDDRAELGDVLMNSDGSLHGEALVKVTVLDLGADRTAPVVERELYLEGYALTSRRVGDVVRLASYGWFNVPGLQNWLEVDEGFWNLPFGDAGRVGRVNRAFEEAAARNEQVLRETSLEHFVPRLFEARAGRIEEIPLRADNCRNVSIPEDGVAFGFTSLLTLALGDTLQVEADHVVTNYPILYSSENTLLLTEPAQDFWWYWGNTEFDEATNIHRFALEGATTTYTGSGRVDGTLLGQFALDEHDDIVRVAATKGQWNRWWMEEPAPSTTHVTTLGGERSLEVLGTVEGIAPEERLWSVRFTDDEAYLVTFRNVDPLWTVDLSNPSSPRILGELKVPGVSTYIHPLGDHLLTIGIGGTGEGLDWGVTQLSMFDISDRTAPRVESELRLSAGETADGWQYGYSEATYEHKAFTYWGPMAAVAVPLSTYRSGFDGSFEYRSELVLARAEAGTPLTRLGTVDHSDFYNSDSDWWWSSRDIRRSIFMGEFIYAISDRGATCHRLEDYSLAAAVELDGSHAGR